MNNEDRELNEFIIKLAHKIKEAQDDYKNLSDNNKARAENLIKNIFKAQGIAGLLNYLNGLTK